MADENESPMSAVFNAAIRDMETALIEQLNQPSFFSTAAWRGVTPPPPRYGPEKPTWDISDMAVEWVDADHRRFSTWVDWEEESVVLDREQAMELLEMLERWLRP